MKVSTREKYFLFVGAGALLLTLLVLFGDRLIPSGQEGANDPEHKKQLLVKYRETLDQEESYKARVEKYRERLKQDETLFLSGDNPSIAGAELTKVLSDIAARTGVEISRKDIQPEQKIQNNVVKVSVRIETNCLPDQLVKFISAIENYEKFVTLDELTINSFRMQKKYEPIKKELEATLNRFKGEGGEQQFFEFLKQVRAGKANLSPQIRPIVENALSDRQLLYAANDAHVALRVYRAWLADAPHRPLDKDA